MQQRASVENAQAFFRQLLAGSTMTSLVSHLTPSTTNVLNSMVVDTIPLVSFKSHGITAATVIKGAWALVLAEINSLQTTLDLLRHVQDQQISSIPHEHLGFQESSTNARIGLRGFASVPLSNTKSPAMGGVGHVSIDGVSQCSPGFICPAPDA
ncbi:hypothetical protein AJ79_01813 [Helicocarpus griseus UAMH5409]|uniref:Uncharacterized protein n=1 Tax=Helicocarpus griseus UAMH5409 TaxID=1447875 RepID=A0A2B7XWX3_9EURO|nr:hypothetical protein AJ79_01813 [Helicocarpus griseus UAMH5409]